MFDFQRLMLENVQLYDGLDLDLSPTGGKNTVLIRGHSEHGKTALFRALTWVVFGEDGLNQIEPGLALQAVRDLDSDGEQTHTGTLEFGNGSARFRIRRTAVSTANHVRETQAVFERFDPAAAEKPWQVDPKLGEDLQDFYFPPALAAYLFINADRVEQIVDKGKAKGSATAEQVTAAINAMLGIDAVDKAAERVRERRKVLETRYTELVGPQGAAAQLVAEVQRLQDAKDAQDGEVGRLQEEIAERESTLAQQQAELHELEDNADDTAIYHAKGEADHAVQSASEVVRDLAGEIRNTFASRDLLMPMFTKQLGFVHEKLDVLWEEGIIPQAELPLIKKLLDPKTNHDQNCLCEVTDISEGAPARATLQKKVDRSQSFEEDAHRLDKFREDLRAALADFHVADNWWASFASLQGRLRTARGQLDDAVAVARHAQEAVDRYESDGSKKRIRTLRKTVHDGHVELDRARQRLGTAQYKLDGGVDENTGVDHGDGLKTELRRAIRKLSDHRDNQIDARPTHMAINATETISQVLSEVIERIHANQVPEVSAQLNDIFLDITNNGVLTAQNDEGDDAGQSGASGSVGIRRTARTDHFELYAETGKGNPKPISVLNGASRRALTVAFVVALLKHSGAPIPMVSDSLFNTVNGDVKRKLANHLLSPAVQKIVFFFHDDVANPKVRAALTSQAARTYTVSNSRKPRELENAPTPKGNAVVMVCTCGPDAQCPTCELAHPSYTLPSGPEQRVL